MLLGVFLPPPHLLQLWRMFYTTRGAWTKSLPLIRILKLKKKRERNPGPLRGPRSRPSSIVLRLLFPKGNFYFAMIYLCSSPRTAEAGTSGRLRGGCVVCRNRQLFCWKLVSFKREARPNPPGCIYKWKRPIQDPRKNLRLPRAGPEFLLRTRQKNLLGSLWKNDIPR